MTKYILGLILSAMVLSTAAHAHFPFLHWTELEGTPVLQVYFGETAAPDDPQYLDRLVDGKTWQKTGDTSAQPIAIKREGDFLVARPTVDEPSVFGFEKNWGTISRGTDTFELIYFAKTYTDPAAWTQPPVEKGLDLVPEYKGGKLIMTTYWNAEPLPNAEIHLQGGVESFEGVTDEKGQFQCELTDPALYGVRVRNVVPADEQSGTPDRRYYSTATFELKKAP